MSLRGRVTLTTVAVVAVTVVSIALASYFALRSALYGDVDERLTGQAVALSRAAELLGDTEQAPRGLEELLRSRAQGGQTGRAQDGVVTPGPQGGPFAVVRPGPGGPVAYAQVLDENGEIAASFGPLTIPVSARDRQIAAGAAPDELTSRETGGVRLRVLTFHRAGGGGGQVAQPLTDVDNALSNLAVLLLVLCGAAVVVAAVAARLASRRVVAPIIQLSEAASRIEQTGDLDHRIETASTDEVGTLATRFNAMLDRLRNSQQALQEALDAQRQFVADASHELRTPVTSIRTNAELLAEDHEIAPEERRAMARDIAQQAAEMTAMMGALIELARGDTGLHEADRVNLADVVRREAERVAGLHPGVVFDLQLDESVVAAHPGLIGRVVGNVLDNAAKFGNGGGAVEISLADGTLAVTDHGAGIAAADLPHVFDRFYRGDRARSLPGSGLGLAIVKQVVEAHGGKIWLVSHEGEGTTVTIMLPLANDEGTG